MARFSGTQCSLHYAVGSNGDVYSNVTSVDDVTIVYTYTGCHGNKQVQVGGIC